MTLIDKIPLCEDSPSHVPQPLLWKYTLHTHNIVYNRVGELTRAEAHVLSPHGAILASTADLCITCTINIFFRIWFNIVQSLSTGIERSKLKNFLLIRMINLLSGWRSRMTNALEKKLDLVKM